MIDCSGLGTQDPLRPKHEYILSIKPQQFFITTIPRRSTEMYEGFIQA